MDGMRSEMKELKALLQEALVHKSAHREPPAHLAHKPDIPTHARWNSYILVI